MDAVAGKTSANSSLHQAKATKNDEFYTRLEDIERELVRYRDHFRDKVVLLNCDDPEWSSFWRYFELNFEFLGLQKLISTHYSNDGAPTYKLELIRGNDLDGNGVVDGRDLIKTPLAGNGDFRSDECVGLLEEADIVVTNPPFSLFREYVAQLVERGKKFVIVGNKNAITYKEVWPLIQSSLVWLGVTPMGADMLFRVPEQDAQEMLRSGREGSQFVFSGDEVLRRAASTWFTNLDHARRHEDLPLFRQYDPATYPRYDNFEAINIDKVADIPVDYDGAMGVPITFLGKHNPGQFEIVGLDRYAAGNATPGKRFTINGRESYARVVIRRRKAPTS